MTSLPCDQNRTKNRENDAQNCVPTENVFEPDGACVLLAAGEFIFDVRTQWINPDDIANFSAWLLAYGPVLPTITEDNYVVVRGLGERYSSAILDGSRLPSTNPNKRVVPLDLFPADFIESGFMECDTTRAAIKARATAINTSGSAR